jgi:hypothetical protein
MEKKYNRAAQDIGNIVGIGHVNVASTISTRRQVFTSPGWAIRAIRFSIPAPATCGSTSA